MINEGQRTMPDAEQEHTNQDQPGPHQKPVQPSEHATALAHEWAERYGQDRPTVKLPDSHGMASATAVDDWIEQDDRASQD
jgi:hypothetical protein